MHTAHACEGQQGVGLRETVQPVTLCELGAAQTHSNVVGFAAGGECSPCVGQARADGYREAAEGA